MTFHIMPKDIDTELEIINSILSDLGSSLNFYTVKPNRRSVLATNNHVFNIKGNKEILSALKVINITLTSLKDEKILNKLSL